MATETGKSSKTATSLGDSARDVLTLMNKSGRFTPERQKQLDELASKQAEQERVSRARKLRSQSNVFPKYEIASLHSIEVPTAKLPVEMLMRYVEARDQLKEMLGVPSTKILRGANGPGKTYLASALVNEFCDQGRAAFYCRAVDFFTMVKSTFGEKGRTLEELERKFRCFECLVIDEIEVRSESPWENNVLRSLVDARYASLRATVIISNKGKDELSAYFSPAIISRINEGGGIVHCDWPSLR